MGVWLERVKGICVFPWERDTKELMGAGAQRGFSDARIQACVSKDHASSVPTRREILSALFLLLVSKAG